MALNISPTNVALNLANGKFNTPFDAQLAYFRQKLNLPTNHYDDIIKDAHDRAFVVSGATKADLLNDLRGAVDRSIADGKSFAWFKDEFENIVKTHGWVGWTGEDTAVGRDWRARIIYNTNLDVSYAAGRWQQLNDPDLVKSRPYWRYIHNDSVLHPRPLHKSWNGLVLHKDDPFWESHFPPNGWGCQCRVEAVRPSQYKGDSAPDDGNYNYTDRNGNSHTIPNGIDYGWDYAPGASVFKPDSAPIINAPKMPQPLQMMLSDKIKNWSIEIAAAFIAEMSTYFDNNNRQQ